MPRNSNNKHCHTPGCKAWSMRDHNRCRSHLDHVLGPRAAGPLNTLVLPGKFCGGLITQVAEHTFIKELTDYINKLRPERRATFQSAVWKQALSMALFDKVRSLRSFIKVCDFKDIHREND